jgi:drug/metabolite transporter (DMT)-like permease
MIRAFCGGIFLLFSFWSARVMNYGDATALSAPVPIFAALSSRVLWREKLSMFTLLAMVIGLGGTLLISKPTFIFGYPDGSENKEYNSFFPLVPISASIILGFGLSFMRKIGSDVSPLLVSLIVALFNVVNGIVFQFCYGDKFLLPMCFVERSTLLASGILLILALLFLNRGLSLEKSGVGTTMTSSDIVIAYFLQIVFFDTVPDVTSIIGALLVISSIVLVSLDNLILKCFKFEV